MAEWNEIVALARDFPGVEESVSYGEPSLKVRKSLLARWRMADNSLVLLGIEPDERALLIDQEPDVFFLEPHYTNYPIVLVRLDRTEAPYMAPYLARRWRNIAPKRLIMAFDANR